MRRLQADVIFWVTCLTIVSYAWCQTPLGGNVTVDTAFNVSSSPYIVTEDITVDHNVTLTIEPGAELRFNPGVGMIIHGSLQAEGLDQQRITLTASIPSMLEGNPYSWSGIEWAADADVVEEYDDLIGTTHSASILSYVDVTFAGVLFVGDPLMYTDTCPALSAIRLAPLLSNVSISDNYGDAVSWQNIKTTANIAECEISNNTGLGVTFTSNGIGRLYIERSVIDDNNGHGISTSFTWPEAIDVPRHRFCGFQSNITENVVLEYNERDFGQNRSECLQTLFSPHGSTITVYTVSGTDSSGTFLNFWDGNSTNQEDLISIRRVDDDYGHAISSTTNAMTIRVPEPVDVTPRFTLLVTIQSGTDYDLVLNNVRVTNNAVNGIDVQESNRVVQIADSFICDNGRNGLTLGENYGELIMVNTVSENNGQSGISVLSDLSSVSIDWCSFGNNTLHGIDIGIESTPNRATYVSMRDSSMSFNGGNGIEVNIKCGPSNQFIDLDNCSLSWNGEGGSSFIGDNSCESSDDLFTTPQSSKRISVNNSEIVNSQNGFQFLYCVDFQLLISDTSFVDVEFGIQVNNSFVQDKPNMITNTRFQSDIVRSSAIDVQESLYQNPERYWIVRNCVITNYNSGIRFSKEIDTVVNYEIFHRSVVIKKSNFSSDYQAIYIEADVDLYGGNVDSILDFRDNVTVDGCLFESCDYGINIDRDVFSYDNNPTTSSIMISDVIQNSKFTDEDFAIHVRTDLDGDLVLDKLETQLVVTNCRIQLCNYGIKCRLSFDRRAIIPQRNNIYKIDNSEFSNGFNSVHLYYDEYVDRYYRPTRISSSEEEIDRCFIRNCTFLHNDGTDVYVNKETFLEYFQQLYYEDLYDIFPEYTENSIVLENCEFNRYLSSQTWNHAVRVNVRYEFDAFVDLIDGSQSSDTFMPDLISNGLKLTVVRNCSFINYKYPVGIDSVEERYLDGYYIYEVPQILNVSGKMTYTFEDCYFVADTRGEMAIEIYDELYHDEANFYDFQRVSHLTFSNCIFINYDKAIELLRYIASSGSEQHKVLGTIENSQFHGNSESISALQFIYEDYTYQVQNDVRAEVWNITGCFFRDYGKAIHITQERSIEFGYERAFSVDDCWFLENGHAILFDNDVYQIDSGYIVVSNSVFEHNQLTVIQIPNTMSYCRIFNNTFLNNTGAHIIDIYEAKPFPSVATNQWSHVLEGNSFIDNTPWSDGDDSKCAIATSIGNTVLNYNEFDNKEYPFEVCPHRYLLLNIDTVNARFNQWHSFDKNEINSKIFDFNDWNDRPLVSFEPFLVDSTNVATMNSDDNNQLSILGGIIRENIVLTPTNEPYLVHADVTVLENTTLTIEAGTELQFQPNVGLLILGRLKALGSKDNHIKLNAAVGVEWSVDNGVNMYGDIRLTNGPLSWYGRLEIYANGLWAPLYLHRRGPETSEVACRQLGFGPPVGYYPAYESVLGLRRNSKHIFSLDYYMQCNGREEALVDCYKFRLDPCYFCDYSNDELVLECSPLNETETVSAGNSGFWGGVRIIGNSQLQQAESVLQYIDIIGAGKLHNKNSPGLLLRNVSPTIEHVSVIDCASVGIFIDNPTTEFSLTDSTVTRCSADGILLNHAILAPVLFTDVFIRETVRSPLRMVQNTKVALFSDSLFNMKPVCSGKLSELIEVVGFTELLYHTLSASCDIIIRPNQNETLLIEIFRLQRFYDAFDCNVDMRITDEESQTQLGVLYCQSDETDYFRIETSGTVRFSSTLSDNYYSYQGFDDNDNEFADEDLGTGFYIRVVPVGPDYPDDTCFGCDGICDLASGSCLNSSTNDLGNICTSDPEFCKPGWQIRHRNRIDPGGLTMVSPDQQFHCYGQVTTWRYWGRSNPFRAIVWRPILGSDSEFQIVGINDIPYGPEYVPVNYDVPEADRISIQPGDVIGWSFEAPVLYFDDGGIDRVRWLSGYLSGSLVINQTLVINSRVEKRRYSIEAIAEPQDGACVSSSGGLCDLTWGICTCDNGTSGNSCSLNNDLCVNNTCDDKATCRNTLGSYDCTCNEGFSGDGFTCTDFDECQSNPCDPNAVCSNNDGSFDCICNTGFSGDGFTCRPSDNDEFVGFQRLRVRGSYNAEKEHFENKML